MQALKIDHHGPVTDLEVTEVERPAIGKDEVLVEVEAAGINPSDQVSAEGKFPHSPLPRILGRDFAGHIVEGPAELIGQTVWGAGGDLGISRDGTHAEYVAIPREAVAVRPANLTPAQAAAAGVPYQTAWSALVDLGRMQPGEWVIVSGAIGAVGGAAVQLASALGARVIAVVRNEEEAARLDRSKVAAVSMSDKHDLVDATRLATEGKGANLAVNGVGAVVFGPMFESLGRYGRMVVFSALGGREASFNLFELYRKALTIMGLNTEFLDVVSGARILREVGPLFESGALAPPSIATLYPLSQARDAYRNLMAGKPVLVPDRLHKA